MSCSPAPSRSSLPSGDAWRTAGSPRSLNVKRAFWWGLETPTGVDPSWWTLLKVHNKEGGMKRKEQTCQPTSMGKGLCSLKDIHFTRLQESNANK